MAGKKTLSSSSHQSLISSVNDSRISGVNAEPHVNVYLKFNNLDQVKRFNLLTVLILLLVAAFTPTLRSRHKPIRPLQSRTHLTNGKHPRKFCESLPAKPQLDHGERKNTTSSTHRRGGFLAIDVGGHQFRELVMRELFELRLDGLADTAVRSAEEQKNRRVRLQQFRQGVF